MRAVLLDIPSPRLLRLFLPLVLVLALGGCGRGDSEAPGDQRYLNTSADARYLGIDACKSCHADKFSTFQHTGMGMSFKAASLQLSVADWESPEAVYDPHADLHYQPFHRGDELFVREYRLRGGDTVHVREERIDYIVGSGQHTNSHIMNVNGYLYQMPLTWYAQEGRWDLPPGFEDGNNTRFSREIPLECMTCHNARPGYVPNSGNRFAHVPQGIDCEQCHGPGSIHVALMERGEVVDTSTAIDYSIVNPGNLSMNLQFDVCQRCHMQGMAVLEEGKSFLDFRPSTPLENTLNVYWPRYSDSLSSFIMASHPDRLQMSPCFAASHSDDTSYQPMTCVTCHDPHVSVRVTGPETFNRACQTCHTPAHDNLCTESLAVRERVGDDCASCHMPKASSLDIPHVTITDHFIRVVEELPEEVVEEQREFLGIASLVDANPTTLNLAKGYLTYFEQFDSQPKFLDSAAVNLERVRQESGGSGHLETEVRLAFLQGAYDRLASLARSISPEEVDDPWTLYRIGEAFRQTGGPTQAVAFLEQAVRIAPDHLEFRAKLGNAYVRNGNPSAALEQFNLVVEANPKFESAYNNRGFIKLASGDFESAEADFVRALELNPDAEQALANLASLYFNTGRAADARPLAERLLSLSPENPQYRQLWQALQ